jgi:hypothetical protein
MPRPSNRFAGKRVDCILAALLDALVDEGKLVEGDLHLRVEQAEREAGEREAEWVRARKARPWWWRLWN